MVSIGLVTYNRATLLPRAIKSVLAQTHTNFELLISDDNSTDNTAEIVPLFSKTDHRIRYIKRTGIGMTQNFIETLNDATGDYFMWLCDDDYLAPDYIEKCLSFLQQHPDYSLATGTTKFFSATGIQERYEQLALEADTPEQRVYTYFRDVISNIILYGLMRGQAILSYAYPDTFGADLLWSCQLAFAGKVKLLDDTFFYYSVEGISQQTDNLKQYYKSTKERKENPYKTLRKEVYKLVLSEGKVFKTMNALKRWLLAVRLWIVIRERFCMPSIEAKIRGRLSVRTRFKKIFG